MLNQGIAIRVKDVIIGRVRGDTFYKRINGKHYLRKPPAIAFDVSAIIDAQRAGAVKVEVRDMDSGKEFTAPIQLILDKGFRFERGHGQQIGLVVGKWQEKVAAKELVGA